MGRVAVGDEGSSDIPGMGPDAHRTHSEETQGFGAPNLELAHASPAMGRVVGAAEPAEVSQVDNLGAGSPRSAWLSQHRPRSPVSPAPSLPS